MRRMLDFLKKTLPDDFFQGACDVHCHILPGVDDGFKDEETAINALRFLERKGFEKVRLTPHFMKEYADNTKEHIAKVFEDFKQKATQSCGIQLYLGAEYMLDAGFPEHFKQGFLTFDQSDVLVLCETSYMMNVPNMKEMLYDVMCEGYSPVIAHPERYQYASRRQYEHWKSMGYQFQLNLLSLTGLYGAPAFEKSHDMLQKKMYDYVGTDMHRLDNFINLIPKLKLKTKEIDALHKLYENNRGTF